MLQFPPLLCQCASGSLAVNTMDCALPVAAAVADLLDALGKFQVGFQVGCLTLLHIFRYQQAPSRQSDPVKVCALPWAQQAQHNFSRGNNPA